MAEKTYTVGDDAAGIQFVQDRLGITTEKGKTHKVDLTREEEKAVVAAGWLIPKEGK